MAEKVDRVNTGGVTPLFVKHNDLGIGNQEKLEVYDFAKILFANGLDRAHLEGAQRVKGLWRIYINDAKAKAEFFVKGLSYRGKSVPLMETNPFRTFDGSGEPDKRHIMVSIQQLPLSVSNQEIKIMLERLGCKLEGEMKYEFARDDDRQLTTIKTGNRTVIVNDSVKDNPLPRFHFCGNWRCRIYHPGQKPPEKKCFKCLQTGHLKFQCQNERVCRACRQPGHTEGETECEHYKPHDAVCFQGDRDVFSNWYPCNIQWEGHAMHCSEQVYGYELCKANNRDDIKNDILRTKNGKEVKDRMKKY